MCKLCTKSGGGGGPLLENVQKVPKGGPLLFFAHFRECAKLPVREDPGWCQGVDEGGHDGGDEGDDGGDESSPSSPPSSPPS